MSDAAVKPPSWESSENSLRERSIFSLQGESGVIWTVWFTYGVFYFCRTNTSVAIKGMEAPISSGGLGLSSTDIGWILAALKISYGLGQLLNGQLSERIPPRVMLALGMFGSAALNVLFGMSTGFYFLLFVWAMNGFCQSLGWTPCMRVVANWVAILRRGKAIGIIGTGYQITQGLTYLIAGQAAQHFGWRGAFYVPAVILALSGVFMLLFLREAPETAEESALRHHEKALPAQKLSVSDNLYWTLYNPTLWLLGLSLGLLNACRYGFLDWGVKHIMDTQKLQVSAAAVKFFVIAIGATAGSYLAGWATDRFFGSRRAPVASLLMAALGVIALFYNQIVQQSPNGTLAALVAIGFCIFGPQVLLVGTAPTDMAHRGAAAAAAGFVNFMGYIGAATGDVITGYYAVPSHGGWEKVIQIWGAWAFAGSVIMAILWNTTTRNIGVLPGLAPKIAAVTTMLAAAVSITFGDHALALRVATYAGVLCLFGAFLTRRLAAVGLLIAAAGLLTVFVTYARGNTSVTWDQSLAMVAFGLAIITSLMILVEKKETEACELS